MRHSVRITVAVIPICAYVGKKAASRQHPQVTKEFTITAIFLPKISPIYPKKTAPIGAKKYAEKKENAGIKSLIHELTVGKNKLSINVDICICKVLSNWSSKLPIDKSKSAYNCSLVSFV
jgi:hypothetical protein